MEVKQLKSSIARYLLAHISKEESMFGKKSFAKVIRYQYRLPQMLGLRENNNVVEIKK
jgi:hypothetical protein